MNERMTRNILEQARSCLEPTDADRDRMRKKVMGAVGAGAVVTAAAAAAASTAGTASTGLPLSALTVLKLSVGGLLIGGAAVFTALSVSPTKVPVPHSATNDTAHDKMTDTKRGSAFEAASVENVDEAPTLQEVTPPGEAASPSEDISETHRSAAKSTTRRDTESKKSSNSTPQNDNTLLVELRLIRAAAKALTEDDPQTASMRLEQYDKQFPDGVMRQERDGLEISVLCRLGHESAAKHAERKFKARYPTAPLAIRVEEGCRSNNEESP